MVGKERLIVVDAQPDLFGPRPPRRKPRVLMRVQDGGYEAGPIVDLKCGRCGHETGMVPEEPGDIRGRPCPKCNKRRRPETPWKSKT